MLGFRVPAADVNPPKITGLELSQRFLAGQSVPVVVSAADDSSIGTVEVSWRSTDIAAWQSVTMSIQGSGRYGGSIQTSAADERINLKMKISDPAGNYIEYTTTNASLVQVPVLFSLSANLRDIEYKNADVIVTLTGRLTDALEEAWDIHTDPLGRRPDGSAWSQCAELAKLRLESYVTPMIQHSGLSHLITSADEQNTRKTGKTDKKIEWVGGGFLIPFGAQNANKLRSVSIQVLLRDKIDGYPDIVGKDGASLP